MDAFEDKLQKQKRSPSDVSLHRLTAGQDMDIYSLYFSSINIQFLLQQANKYSLHSFYKVCAHSKIQTLETFTNN